MIKRIIRRIIARLQPAPPAPGHSNGPRIGANTVFDSSKTGIHNSIGANCYLYNSSIGDFTYLSSSVAIMNTIIGKFCSIAQGVCIGLGEHPSSKFASTHPAFFSPHRQCGYTFANDTYFPEMGVNHIGNDVWIGVNAIILNNVNVGNGAIIGAGAVVTKDVPAYAIVVGSPAKVLRYRFTEQEIDKLQKTQWWDLDYKWLEANFSRFHDIDEFLVFMEQAVDHN